MYTKYKELCCIKDKSTTLSSINTEKHFKASKLFNT